MTHYPKVKIAAIRKTCGLHKNSCNKSAGYQYFKLNMTRKNRELARSSALTPMDHELNLTKATSQRSMTRFFSQGYVKLKTIYFNEGAKAYFFVYFTVSFTADLFWTNFLPCHACLLHNPSSLCSILIWTNDFFSPRLKIYGTNIR